MSVESYRKQILDEIENSRRRAAAAPDTPGGVDVDAAVALLADRAAPADERRLALQTLKQAATHHPAYDEWRPRYLEALRTAARSRDRELREAAAATLAQYKDPWIQERLLDGLRDPSAALVPPEDALQLLGYDPHAEVQRVAERIADDPPSPEARREALRVLASDPGSEQRFAELFGDRTESPEVRRLAATALSSIAPGTFRRVAEDVVAEATAEPLALDAEPAATAAPPDEVARHAARLLALVERAERRLGGPSR